MALCSKPWTRSTVSSHYCSPRCCSVTQTSLSTRRSEYRATSTELFCTASATRFAPRAAPSKANWPFHVIACLLKGCSRWALQGDFIIFRWAPFTFIGTPFLVAVGHDLHFFIRAPPLYCSLWLFNSNYHGQIPYF